MSLNPIKGETPLKLSDGREYTLVFDMEALVQAEAVYGKPLAAMMADASNGFVGASRAILYGALQAKHPGATVRAASEILASDAEAVSAALEAAAAVAFPLDTGDEGKGSPPRRGKTSGRSGAKPG